MLYWSTVGQSFDKICETAISANHQHLIQKRRGMKERLQVKSDKAEKEILSSIELKEQVFCRIRGKAIGILQVKCLNHFTKG